MKRLAISVFFFSLASAAPAAADVAGRMIAAEDGCQINRGQDQFRSAPGTAIETGDVIKCLGRTHAKAIMGKALVLFGPLSETRIATRSPLTLELVKGTLRVITEPGETAPFTIKTAKASTTSQRGDVSVRYNASSEFTEVVVVDGSATAMNTVGATGSTELKARESTLLTPESSPTQPSLLQPNELRDYTKDTEYSAAPLPNGDMYRAIEPTLQRLDSAYAEARRKLARPSLPENAPFRSLDSRREAFAAPQFDQPGRDAAPGNATLELKWTSQPPKISGAP